MRNYIILNGVSSLTITGLLIQSLPSISSTSTLCLGLEIGGKF